MEMDSGSPPVIDEGSESMKAHPPHLLSTRRQVGSVAFSGTMTFVIWAFYIFVSGIILRRYYGWAQEAITELTDSGMCDKDMIGARIKSDHLRVFNHAPDLFLPDAVSDAADKVPLEHMSDLLPTITLVIGTVIAFIGRDFYFINRTFFIIYFLILMNIISEFITGFPPSIGLYRCLEKSGAFDGGAVDVTIEQALANATAAGFILTPFGTCTAMMWSGHTSYTMLGLWAALMGFMSIRKPAWWKPGGENTWWITGALLLIGLLEGALILLHDGHYGADIFLAIMLTIFATRSEDLAYLAMRVNPFLPTLSPRE